VAASNAYIVAVCAAASHSSLFASFRSTSNSIGGAVVVVQMEVVVEMVVKTTGRRWHGSSLQRWCASDEACFEVEKGMLAVMVMSIERRQPFIGGGDTRRGRKKAREGVRSRGKKALKQAVA
jgi:hypothetical protein